MKRYLIRWHHLSNGGVSYGRRSTYLDVDTMIRANDTNSEEGDAERISKRIMVALRKKEIATGDPDQVIIEGIFIF